MAPPLGATTWHRQQAVLVFSGLDEAGIDYFHCRLDDNSTEAWGRCSSAWPYTGLADGAHTFEVKAFDINGNVDPTPALKLWTVDMTAPVVEEYEDAYGIVFRAPDGVNCTSFICTTDNIDTVRGGRVPFGDTPTCRHARIADTIPQSSHC